MNDIILAHGAWNFSDLEMLGEEGGFGEVFEGRAGEGNPWKGGAVAIKRLKESRNKPRECDIAAKLIGCTYSHLIPIYDVGRDPESEKYFIVMAKADQNLRQQVLERGRTEADVAVLCRDIVEGLTQLHNSKIVHRDLKPENILQHQGIWKLADFGISRDRERATSSNTFRSAGTQEYAAPEQWRGESSTAKTDIYALGCIAFELFTGHPPFAGPDFRAQHLTAAPPPVHNASSAFSQLVFGCLAKEPESRPDLQSVARLLQECISPSPTDTDDLLRSVGVELVAEQAAEQATAAKLRNEQERREKIGEDATRLLLQMRKDLVAWIRKRAPTLILDSTHDRFLLGKGYLRLDLVYQHIGNGEFNRSGWDVVVGAKIAVMQEGNGGYLGRSANLWFGKIDKQGDHRWWEVAYMTFMANPSDPRVLPIGFDTHDGMRYADEAASNVIGAYQHAGKPKRIDNEYFEAFCGRWGQFLAYAARNAMEYPRYLPED
jgi:eukaryotic-like serine/threonine-protein kinase